MNASAPFRSLTPDIAWRGMRVADLDRFARARLADSVLTIGQALDGAAVTDLHAALAVVREAPAHPGLFALYHDTAVAACADRYEEVHRLLGAFARLALDPAPLVEVATLRDDDLGEGFADLYERMVDDDEAFDLQLQSVEETDLARTRGLTDEARILIAAADPAIDAEIALLGRQIVVAKGRAGAGQFGGAATFFLWGALFVNPVLYSDRLTLAESLVHESGHALLFGLSNAEPLVLNAPDEVFTSPLRKDLRPMEGLVHAAYVCARMARFMDLVQNCDGLSAAERDKVVNMARENRTLLHSGMETIQAHARFSVRGREIFESEVSGVLSG